MKAWQSARERICSQAVTFHYSVLIVVYSGAFTLKGGSPEQSFKIVSLVPKEVLHFEAMHGTKVQVWWGSYFSFLK